MNLKSPNYVFGKLNQNDNFQILGWNVYLQSLICNYVLYKLTLLKCCSEIDEWSLIEVKDSGESVNQKSIKYSKVPPSHFISKSKLLPKIACGTIARFTY